MYLDLLVNNLLSPALLFFIFGIIAVKLKSDLEIPKSSSKFISIYLLFSIGFNGGQELSHNLNFDILKIMGFSVLTSLVIPIYVFFLIKKRMGIYNAGAISSSYGSVSAVTFVTAIAFLEICKVEFSGYMVAALALMEAPAIIMGVILTKYYDHNKDKMNLSKIIKHSLTNSSVLLILASLVIGVLSSEGQANDIKPFTTDIFKGFLAIFLLDMGIKTGNKIKDFIKNGWSVVLYAILFSLINGIIVSLISSLFIEDLGNRFLVTILAASASYIAVPAAMKMAIPKANHGIYLPMALGISFPFNITLGFPIYYYLCTIL